MRQRGSMGRRAGRRGQVGSRAWRRRGLVEQACIVDAGLRACRLRADALTLQVPRRARRCMQAVAGVASLDMRSMTIVLYPMLDSLRASALCPTRSSTRLPHRLDATGAGANRATRYAGTYRRIASRIPFNSSVDTLAMFDSRRSRPRHSGRRKASGRSAGAAAVPRVARRAADRTEDRARFRRAMKPR